MSNVDEEILAQIEGRRLGFTADNSLHFKGAGLQEFGAVFITINDTEYTLQFRDSGCVVMFTASQAIALSLPPDMPRGFNCMLFQEGTGNVQFVVPEGTTLVSRFAGNALGGQYALGSLMCYTNPDLAHARYVFGGDGA
jgi:hypothetical protein